MKIKTVKEMESLNAPYGGKLFVSDRFFSIYNTAERADFYYNGWAGWYEFDGNEKVMVSRKEVASRCDFDDFKV